ncbi:hypothetical protein [Campylobacter sp.]|uniref:hypothetical protein n=1 Tax=Campylobacter sp. TaxID=205 RepID=UPI002AA6244F|nr:hypothetical protein [Campylobacter sp.]MCI6298050.1 hypothetical protein [Campylobacter sp.]MCI6564408.1 hypothetical protein [Campylobacter sp.]MCI6578947.1 hypothetical protein [Campylobacter sp.]
MNRIINFFLAGIFTIFIVGFFVIFIQELFWLLGYFGFTDSLVIDVFYIIYLSFAIFTKLTGLEIDDDPFLAIGAGIIFVIPALIIYIYIFIFFFLIFILYILVELPDSEIHPGDLTPVIFFVVPVITLIIFIFILKIFAKITMKFLDDFRNKTYSKSFYFIVFLFFNCIYLFIFLGFSHSKFSELSNENLLFLVLAFCLGLISTYLTKIKFFKGEKYV